jgi:anti-anti-sigma factor
MKRRERMNPFKVEVFELTPGVWELRITGSVDPFSIGILKRALENAFDQGVYRLIVNLKEVSWIASSGFGYFITSIDTARENGGQLVFMPEMPQMKQLADLLGLSETMLFADDVDAAVNQMALAG